MKLAQLKQRNKKNRKDVFYIFATFFVDKISVGEPGRDYI